MPLQIPADIFFEASYVLGLRLAPYVLELEMDFVLTPEHPEYLPPPIVSQECYRHGMLRIENFRNVIWEATGSPPSHDAVGEIDYGNLDELTHDGSAWLLVGEWGTIKVEGGTFSLVLDTLPH